MTCWLHPEAEQELFDAAEYYARKASPVVARAFLSEYEKALALLSTSTHLGRSIDANLRVLRLDRFPYSLIYAADVSGHLQIFAVAHHRREPRYWRTRQP